jgi:Fic family protein
MCPSLSASTVERHLKKLVDEGKLTRIGAGKTTVYIKTW